MSATTRILAMLAGVALLQVLWLANRYVAENYWKAATEDADDGEEPMPADERAGNAERAGDEEQGVDEKQGGDGE